MPRDLLSELQTWLNSNPDENEQVIIRAPGKVIVKLHYGSRTTVTKEGRNLTEALTAALDRARELPSHAQKTKKAQISLPGL